MKQKNSYFGSIFERSKTSVLPQPVNRYVLPQLQGAINMHGYEIDTAAQESASFLESIHQNSEMDETSLETVKEVSGENIISKSNNRAGYTESHITDKSNFGDKPVKGTKEESGSVNLQSQYEAYHFEKSADVNQSASSSETSHRSLKTEKPVLETITESHKEESSSIPALIARRNILKKKDSFSVPDVPVEKPSMMSAVNVNQSVSSSETSHRSLKTEKPALETITEPLKKQSISFPTLREGGNIPEIKDSISVLDKVDISNRDKRPQIHINPAALPYKQSETDTAETSSLKTKLHDTSDQPLGVDIIKMVPKNKENTEKEPRKIEEGINNLATAQTNHRLPNKITSAQFKKNRDEPSLVIKNINIQIVDNKRTLPAQIKKSNHTESDVLGRSYLWRFNIT